MRREIAILGVAALLCSCSEETNPFAFLVLDASEESHDGLLSEAQRQLDAGNFAEAVELGESAYEMDPGSEKGAVILGYGYMAMAGIDPFSLLAKLMESESKSALTAEEATDSNPLAPLQSLLGLGPDELAAITMPGNKTTLDNGITIYGAPESGVFKDYPVLFPKTASEARESGGEALVNLAKAIKVICPFTAEFAKILSPVADPRHHEEVCPAADKELRFSAKIHFVWAFSHLTEAIAFNSVVLYDPSGKGANIIRRSAALGDANSVGVAAYIAGVSELAASMEIVLPTAESKTQNSMLFGMVNDLQATSNAFDLLPGMPESMTKSIKESIAKLEEQKKKIQSASTGGKTVSEAEASSSALKETLTATMATTIKAQIETRSAAGSFSSTEKAQVCASYSTISSTALDICKK